MKNSNHETPRREFLLGLACFSASAAIVSLAGCKEGTGPQPSPTPEKLAQNASAPPFRVAIQGSFAIFVGNQDIIAYAPNVGTHYYCISDGDYKDCTLGNCRSGLAMYGSPDLSLSGVTGVTTPPVFGTTAGPNAIQTNFNPVVNIKDVTRPGARKYLYAIKLPLPTSVSSFCPVGKDHGEFFVNPPLALDDLVRVHVFEYARYDPRKLAINGKPIQLAPGQTHIKILSEPKDQNATYNECKHHVQMANQAIADMIQLKGKKIAINESYCPSISFHADSKGANGTGDDGNVTTLSSPPACISMLVNDTGTGVVTGARAS